jgi:hypothetical protein
LIKLFNYNEIGDNAVILLKITKNAEEITELKAAEDPKHFPKGLSEVIRIFQSF